MTNEPVVFSLFPFCFKFHFVIMAENWKRTEIFNSFLAFFGVTNEPVVCSPFPFGFEFHFITFYEMKRNGL